MSIESEYTLMEKSELEKEKYEIKQGRLRGDMGDYQREQIRMHALGYDIKPYNTDITQEKDNIITDQYRKYNFTYTTKDINFFNSLYTGLGIEAPFEDTSKLSAGSSHNVRIDMNEIYKFMEYAALSYKDILNDGSKLIKRHKEGDPKIHYGRRGYGAVCRVWRLSRDDVKFWSDNNANDALILSFRGTDDFKDFVDDLSDEPIQLKDTEWVGVDENTNAIAHYGFIQQLESIYEDILKEVNFNPDINIYACGHSLGSSLGVMALYRLYLEGKANNVRYNIKGFYGFGSPKGLFSKNTRIDDLFNIINVFHEKDIISYASPVYYDHLGTKLILSDDKSYKLIFADALTPYLPVNLEFSTEMYHIFTGKLKPRSRHQDSERRMKNLFYLLPTIATETQKSENLSIFTINYDLLQYTLSLMYYVGLSGSKYHGTDNYLSLLRNYVNLGTINEGDNIINVQPFTPMRFIDTLEDKQKINNLIKKNIINISHISQMAQIQQNPRMQAEIIGFTPITYNLNNKFIIF